VTHRGTHCYRSKRIKNAPRIDAREALQVLIFHFAGTLPMGTKQARPHQDGRLDQSAIIYEQTVNSAALAWPPPPLQP
jgi:hypothetical protein